MSKKKKIHSCLIIGAGISGLIIGHVLKRRGLTVTVLDKGRGVGGRMATRRIKDAVIDHGAQFFTSQEERFDQWIDQWINRGLAVEWSRGFQKINAEAVAGDPSAEDRPHYRGVKGMTTIPKDLAKDLEVHLNCPVQRIIPLAKGWEAHAKGGKNFRAQALMMTPPVPQSLSLLADSKIELPSPIRLSLEAITYDPCIAMLALIENPSHIPYPGGLHFNGEPILWIADNQRKGISPKRPSIIIHAGPKFSRENWEADDAHAIEALTEASSQWIGSRIIEWQLHRWRYSQPIQLHHERCLAVPGSWPIIFAGDAFGGRGVEGAVLSGLAAAEHILQ